MWGPDAYEFRPERWLEMKEQVESSVGVYANLYVRARSINTDIERWTLTTDSPRATSPEVSGAASGGDSRALIISYLIHFHMRYVLKTGIWVASSRCKLS